MVGAACQQRWGERRPLLDEENYRLRREHVHAHHGEIGATYFSVTPNDSRTPPSATCLRLTIIIQLYRVTCKDERDASRIIEPSLDLPLFTFRSLQRDEWPAREPRFLRIGGRKVKGLETTRDEKEKKFLFDLFLTINDS